MPKTQPKVARRKAGGLPEDAATRRRLRKALRANKRLDLTARTQEPKQQDPVEPKVDPLELMARGAWRELALFLWPHYVSAQLRGRRARLMQQTKHALEIERHLREARKIRAANPKAALGAMAQGIADDCNRAGRRCRPETVRGHFKRFPDDVDD